ncbi:ABC transporter permease [Paenibacillus hamazuiensis]|uniref:ABC transporter permease n=1 Tax=Paenibacillus hamazuiensis TaxID=2936508 RepID=UPI00200E776E|nr:ABC transporter permease [Paenibacillus hamazuiensis]
MRMAWLNLVNRRVQTLITILVVTVGVAMTLSIMMISGGIRSGIVKASEPFGMIVGSKGSANQLVFNTIFLMDNPLANISLDYYHKLENDPRVTLTVPFALGDNYRGFRLVGTSRDFFSLKGRPADPPYFQLAAGRLFERPFEAVIGAKTAKETGLKIGDKFVSGHGVARIAEGGEEHKENPFTVVGILHSVNAPADQGIYVSMDSYWISHEHEEHHEGAAEADDHDESRGVTAALVKPKSYSDLMRMYQEINKDKEAQAVFPGQVIAKIFDMMGSGEQILSYLSYVVLGMAGLTILLAMYGSTIERRRTVAILRAIGASRGGVVSIVLFESAMVSALGCVIGTAAGYGFAWGMAQYIGSHISISVPVELSGGLIAVNAAVCALGLAAGVAPAISAYRTEAAKYLHAV